jgi:CIC family chloride channel protein
MQALCHLQEGQLEEYGRAGLPVLSADGQRVEGWVTNASVLRALARQIGAAPESRPADSDLKRAASATDEPPLPVPGYRLVEIVIGAGSPVAGTALGDVTWPPACVPVSVLRDGTHRDARATLSLRPADRVSLLVPAPAEHAPAPWKP